MWCRDWTAHSCVTERTLSCINGIKPDGVVLLPRLVGLGSPERGNHFILWVINGTQKNIHIFDSLGIYNTLKTEDRLVLANAFRNVFADLSLWDIVLPPQWKQTDSTNCGVFVCAAAEAIVRGIEMETVPLTEAQLSHLRLYHAAQLCRSADTWG